VLAIGPTTTITPERAAALLAAVRGSRIEAPTASYDPDGRFTHLNFPGRLDIPDTIRLIEDPQRARAQLR
jgi:type IV secretory pathway VirB9-like protein